MLVSRTLILLLTVASLAVASFAIADDLHTLGGKAYKGTLVAVSDSTVTFKSAEGDVTTPLAQTLLVHIREAKDLAGIRYTDVRLLDDTVLHVSKVAYAGDKVTLTLLSGIVMELPFGQLVAVAHDAGDAVLRKQWSELFAKRVKKDRVVIFKDGELNALDGTFGDVDAKGETVSFKSESGDIIPVNLSRVHGLIFYRTEVVQETPTCRVIDTFGNTLSVVKVNYDGKSFALQTTFGARVSFPADSVAKLDFNIGKLTYLSDLEPASKVEKSGAGLITRYRKDANLDGEPIILDKQYAKGLSMHAHTELEYNLAGKYKEFKAVLGVDARISADSQALVSVYCDGEKRFAETAGVKVRPVAVNLKDVQVLKIVVSSRNFLDLHDHATLAEARVSQ